MTQQERDEKAARDYWASNSYDDSVKEAFLAGCTHVRTSPEWLAMEEVVRDARVGVFHHTPCPTHFAVGVCVLEELLTKALKELDRVREGNNG